MAGRYNWQCQECGSKSTKLMRKCRKCGSEDIDLFTESSDAEIKRRNSRGAELMAAQQERFVALLCRLSPENLHMDGECSKAEAKRRYAEIMRAWKALEAEVGRRVSYEEVERLLLTNYVRS